MRAAMQRDHGGVIDGLSQLASVFRISYRLPLHYGHGSDRGEADWPDYRTFRTTADTGVGRYS